MSVSLLLEMAASNDPDRTAVISDGLRLTTQQLSDLADGGTAVIAASGAGHVAYVGTGGAALPVLIFGAGAVTAAESGLSPDGHFYLLGAMFLLSALGAPVATAAALRISV